MTPREIEVLSQVLLGRSNKITGYELSISEHTVKAYLKRLLSKFGASDRTYAVTIANRRGFLDMHQYLYLKLHRSGNTSMTTGDY